MNQNEELGMFLALNCSCHHSINIFVFINIVDNQTKELLNHRLNNCH